MLGESAEAEQVACISHRPDDRPAPGWLELLASGLTFDLSGLAPSDAPTLAPARFYFGLPEQIAGFALEAVVLVPGEHVAAAAATVPVVRVMAGLAARLAAMDGVKAVAWSPAESWMEPGYFQRITANWLAGGTFPGLGLTSLRRSSDGSVESVGLRYFTGQELRLDARNGEDTATTVKLAVRVIDRLVQDGAVADERLFTGPDGEILRAEADPGSAVVRIRREA